MKFVLVLLAIVLLLWMLFGRTRTRRPGSREGSKPAARQPEGMVACAHCGVHLPRSEALQVGALAYCSAAHRDAGPGAGGAG